MPRKKDKKKATIECPHCRKKVHIYRVKKGRVLITTSAGVVLGTVGGFVGAGVGLAFGGGAMAATIPLAAVGVIVGAGLGYIAGDKVDSYKCPKCKGSIRI